MESKKTSGGGSSATGGGSAQAATSHAQTIAHASTPTPSQPIQMDTQTAQGIALIVGELLKPIMEMVVGVVQKMETIEARNGTSKSVSFQNRSAHGSVEEFSDGASFNFGDGNAVKRESERRSSNRSSISSTGSEGKDVGTKLERPKFHVEKFKMVNGIKEEDISDSDFINYLDAYLHYIEQWKSLPNHDNLDYPNEDKVAILNMPPRYAKKGAERIHRVYSTAELRFCTKQQVRDAKFWDDITSEGLRFEIGKTAASEMSCNGTLDTLRKVQWISTRGMIDMKAFATFQHEFKKTVMRLEAGEVIKIEEIHLKDIVISALPDRKLQKELFAKFGQSGSLLTEDFAINLVFDDIESYITTMSKHGLGFALNKMNREREAASFNGKKVHQLSSEFDADTTEFEIEEDFQEHVNAAMASPSPCRFVGIGSDGKLKCKWLAEQEKCSFKHPESDMQLKGRGVSKDVTMSQKHTRKVNMTQFEEESEVEDS